MKKFWRGFVFVIVVVTMIFSQIGSVEASSGGPWPDPWSMILYASSVKIGGQLVPEGTLVQFYCRGYLAGQGTTIDSVDGNGILPGTFVYGTDNISSPMVQQCNEGDLIEVRVNNVPAVYTPELQWHDDHLDTLQIHMLEINLDFEVKAIWEEEAYLAIGETTRPSSIRTYVTDGTILDILVPGNPFWKNEDAATVKAFSVADVNQKTYFFTSHDISVCPVGPNFYLVQGGNLVRAKVENTVAPNLQISMKIGEMEESTINLNAGGSVQIQMPEPQGSIVAKVNGYECARMEWDFRQIPAPRPMMLVPVSGTDRTIQILGDNLFPLLYADYDPENFFVWFGKYDGTGSYTYTMKQILEMGGFWNCWGITFRLPMFMPEGVYIVKVATYGGSASEKSIVATIPSDPRLHKIFLPIIGK